jgi:hypothetical protein
MATSFGGERSRSTRREPSTMGKQLLELKKFMEAIVCISLKGKDKTKQTQQEVEVKTKT